MRRKLLFSLISIVVLSFGGLIAVIATDSHPALGLDLQGGISVTQEPVGDYDSEGLDLAVDRIRERVDSLGVAEPEIIRQGDAIVVNLPGVKNQQDAIDLVKVTGQVYLRPVLQCSAVDPTATTTPEATTTTVVEGPTTVATTPPTDTAAPGPSRRVNSAPPTDPADTTVTSDPTQTTTPSATATTVAGDAATTVPAADTTLVDQNPINTAVAADPSQPTILPLKDGGSCYVGGAEGTGEVFSNDASADIISGGWGVTVVLRDGAAGLDVWNALAAKCYAGGEGCPTRQLAIELDGQIISAPTVNEPRFTGNVSITGRFSESEARDLARVLRSGSLPLTMQTQSVDIVSPTLGKDSLHAAVVSGIVGVALVLIFMLLYYRTLGLIVIGGVAVSGAMIWAVISLLSKTNGLALSLSGIAGIIISVGVTVDSYVVFFERLKDEVRGGRTLRNSAQRGFTDSWHTILVADVVSLIGAGVLWYLTVGSVRNFAFFLGLSTLCDLAVAYYFTRPAVLLLARTDWMARRKVMGLEVVRATATPAGGAS